ncbi:MAG: rod shape-determining protein MreC [Acidimicrobiales bacterium]
MAAPRRNRRPRTTLVVLVLASITIITLDARGGFHRISSGARSVAADAFSPVRTAVDDIIEPVGSFLAGAVHYGALRQQNERLQQQLDQLNMEKASQSYVQQSLTQLKQLSKLYNVPCACNLQPVAAEVTDYGTSNFAATIDISVGRADGVQLGMPVVGGGGLVGQVVQANHHSATVRLITDGQSTVDAVYGTPGAYAEIDGQGAGNPLSAGLIPPNTPLTVGEQFVTSGLQGAEFPGGIPVATVTSARTGLTSSEETVTLRPTADLDHLRYVEVLIWGPPT